MRLLVRMLFLDNQTDSHVLNDNVRKHIQDDLLTVDGGPGPDSYSWLACGDQEKSTGPPLERENNNSAVQDEINAVGNFLNWLWKRLLAILAFMGAAGLVAAIVANSALAALGAALVVVGLAAILVGRQFPKRKIIA